MDLSPELPQQIHQALARGWTVLTANQRAARTLRHAFDLHQRSLGVASWQPPPIFAWDTWLSRLWHQLLIEGHNTELLLNPTQEHTIWRAIIAADGGTSSLRPVDSLAETAADAWLLLNAYRGRRLRDYPGNGDTRVFARWAGEFERHCARAQYLTHAQLPETLRAAISAGHITLPPGLLLIGFDSKTPTQTAIVEAVRTTGSPIEELESARPAPSLTLAAAPTEDAELAACARWLRTRLIEQPASRLAVIVPSLETCRQEIDRIFRQILAPELNDIAAPASTGPYEFSLGMPLAHTPIVATALDLLRWATAPLPLDRVSALLLSPHFAPAGGSEYLARVEFDAFVLRDQHLLQPHISLDSLSALVANPKQRVALPILLNHLRALRPIFNRREFATGERAHADWAAAIHDLLKAAGWALPSHLDSTEFQTRRKWESALDELATLDFDSARVSFADALAALERIAEQTLFAPESHHAPVQIMGPLESAGSVFDAIWFLRANDIAWPARPAPNPLLPLQLQRDLAMPGAISANDAALARRITQRVAASGPTVLFSYAQESNDGPQRPSPALAGIALEARRISEIAPAEPGPAAVKIDHFVDDAPIPSPPDRVFRGGAAILRSQAACGFRAFAEKRLFASALDAASLGLDPTERGSLVHKVLEKFWSKVETQAALKSMTFAERDSVLDDSIDAALTAQSPRVEPGWPRAYLDTERRRLLNLLRPWLDYEAKRTPFAVVDLEKKLSDVQIGPLRLEIRVDRIDTALVDDEPAGMIILDYKTGAAKPGEWLGDRPDAPQVPLYAVASGTTQQLDAVAFANVRPGKDMGLNGYQARKGILPKSTKMKTESLAAQVDKWREVLTSLARDFYSGEARVSPKLYPTTCAYCQQRLLCRLNPSALDSESLEDSDDAFDLLSASSLEADRG